MPLTPADRFEQGFRIGSAFSEGAGPLLERGMAVLATRRLQQLERQEETDRTTDAFFSLAPLFPDSKQMGDLRDRGMKVTPDLFPHLLDELVRERTEASTREDLKTEAQQIKEITGIDVSGVSPELRDDLIAFARRSSAAAGIEGALAGPGTTVFGRVRTDESKSLGMLGSMLEGMGDGGRKQLQEELGASTPEALVALYNRKQLTLPGLESAFSPEPGFWGVIGEAFGGGPSPRERAGHNAQALALWGAVRSAAEAQDARRKAQHAPLLPGSERRPSVGAVLPARPAALPAPAEETGFFGGLAESLEGSSLPFSGDIRRGAKALKSVDLAAEHGRKRRELLTRAQAGDPNAAFELRLLALGVQTLPPLVVEAGREPASAEQSEADLEAFFARQGQSRF